MVPIGIVLAGTVSVLADSLGGSDKTNLAIAGVVAVAVLVGCSVVPRRFRWSAIPFSAAITIAWWLLVVVVDSG